MSKFILLIFVIGIQPVFASSLVYSYAKKLADLDETSLTKVQSKALLNSQAAAITHIMPACAYTSKRPLDIPPFVVVTKLDSSGKVIETWRKGGSDFAICFEKQANHLTLFTPPHANFYTSFEMNLRDNLATQTAP